MISKYANEETRKIQVLPIVVLRYFFAHNDLCYCPIVFSPIAGTIRFKFYQQNVKSNGETSILISKFANEEARKRCIIGRLLFWDTLFLDDQSMLQESMLDEDLREWFYFLWLYLSSYFNVFGCEPVKNQVLLKNCIDKYWSQNKIFWVVLSRKLFTCLKYF